MSAVVTGVLVVIAVALGFLIGRTTGESAKEKASQEAGGRGDATGRNERRGDDGPGGARRSGGSRSERDPAATVRGIARKLDYSPMVQMDFDVMFETYDAIRWMNPEEIQDALAELDSLGGNSQSSMIISMMLINLWAKQDGRGALEYSLASKNPMAKSTGMMSGLMSWVKNDPEGAWKWYEERKKDVKKSGMMGAQIGGMMFAALAQSDMDGAFSRLGELNRQEKQSALSMIGMQNYLDPVKRDDYIRNLEKLGDKELMKSSMQTMVSMWGYQDPQGAIEFVASRDWDEELRDQLNNQVAAAWSNSDAEAALTWRLENIKEGQDRGEIVADSFASWMTQDSESAREWLKDQPEDLRTDQLYQQTAQRLQWSSRHEEAVSWAQQIQDVNSRTASYRTIYNNWKGQDEEGAQEWFDSLDESTRDEIQSGATLPNIEGAIPIPESPVKE